MRGSELLRSNIGNIVGNDEFNSIEGLALLKLPSAPQPACAYWSVLLSGSEHELAESLRVVFALTLETLHFTLEALDEVAIVELNCH